MKGGSKARTGGFGAGLGLAGIFNGVTAVLGVSGGFSGSSSKAWQNSSRKTSLSNLQSLRDNTVQSANSVRSQRATVIQTSSQGESFTVEAESVANYNHCHAMTIQYFEVLRHLQIRQRLSSVQECLFIPLMITGFDFKKTLRWRESLSRFIGWRRMRKGFDAIERIENDYEGSDFLPNGRYADELITNMYGHLLIRFDLTRPKDKDDDYDASAWGFLDRLLPFTSKEFYDNFLKGQATKDKIFQRELAPKIAERFVQSLRFTAGGDEDLEIPLDATLVSSYRAGKSLQVSLNYAGEENNIRRSDIRYVEISGGIADPNGTPDYPFFSIRNLLPANSKVIVWGGVLNYQTKFTSDYIFRNSRIKNDLTGFDDVQIYAPLNRRELRNPREEDIEFSNNLVDHLNANVEFYHKILWMQMSPERRFMFLDGIKVVDNSNISHPQGIERSVASVVENRVIGVAGNSIIMPVASGFRLDPSTQQEEELDLFDLYKPLTPVEPIRVSIPTKGVFAEAIMGQCNSCEHIDEDRYWRWSQEPIPDSPTEIIPIDTSSRQSPTPDLTPTPFSNPMIVQQNAPAAPDPSGIAAASNTLNREFRDMAGLEGTQRNGMETFNKNMDTAATMGKEAASMWKMNQQLEAIKSEKNRGNIDESKAKELSESAIEESFEGGTLEKGINQISKIDDLIKNGSINEDLGEKIKEVILDKVTKDSKQPAINNDAIQKKIESSDKLKYQNGNEEIEIESTSDQNIGKNEIDFNPDINAKLSFVATKNSNKISITLSITNDEIEPCSIFYDAGVIEGGVKKTKENSVIVKPKSVKQVIEIIEILDNGSILEITVDTSPFKGKIGASIVPIDLLFILPFEKDIEYECTQSFKSLPGGSNNPTHEGESAYAVDFAMPLDSDVYASRDGVIVAIEDSFADNAAGYTPTSSDEKKANHVRILHDDYTYTSYSHLKQNFNSLLSNPISIGMKAKGGKTIIGKSGNSGFSTGPHLHFQCETWKKIADKYHTQSLEFEFKGLDDKGFTPKENTKYKRKD